MPLCSEEREILSVLLPFVSQHASPIYIAMRLQFVSQYFWENLGGCGHLERVRNTLVTPAPHIQRKTMNKHLDKIWPQTLQNKANLAIWGPYLFLFIFWPCMWGLGLQKESPERTMACDRTESTAGGSHSAIPLDIAHQTCDLQGVRTEYRNPSNLEIRRKYKKVQKPPFPP